MLNFVEQKGEVSWYRIIRPFDFYLRYIYVIIRTSIVVAGGMQKVLSEPEKKMFSVNKAGSCDNVLLCIGTLCSSIELLVFYL